MSLHPWSRTYSLLATLLGLKGAPFLAGNRATDLKTESQRNALLHSEDTKGNPHSTKQCPSCGLGWLLPLPSHCLLPVFNNSYTLTFWE